MRMIGLITIGQFVVSVLSAGTVGGLISGEMSRRLAARADRKKHLGGLLCDLLEIRFTTNATRAVTKAVASHIPGADARVSVLVTSALQPFIDHTKLHEHYESAIVELAAIDPVLAYDLRSKNLIETIFKSLSQLPLQSPSTATVATQAFKLLDDVGPVFDQAILRVARELGRGRLRQTRHILSKTQEMPTELTEFFSLIPQVMNADQRTPSQAAEEPKTQPPNSQEPPKDANAQAAKGSS
jgi:hypothetical protein